MEGQVLVIPKKHYEGSVFDLEENDYIELMNISKNISQILYKTFNPIKVGMIVEGLELDHIHIKLFPLKKEFGLKVMEPKLTSEEFEKIQKTIIKNKD